MRNCYTHYQNIIAYADWNRKTNWSKYLKRQKRALINSSNELESQLLKAEINIISSHVKQKAIIPNLEPNQEMKDFIRIRGEEFSKQFLLRREAYKSKITEKSSDIEDLTAAAITGIEAFDALSCIKWSFNILKALKYC